MMQYKTVDHFCQTWSLIIVIYIDKYLKSKLSDDNNNNNNINYNNDNDPDNNNDVSYKENIIYYYNQNHTMNTQLYPKVTATDCYDIYTSTTNNINNTIITTTSTTLLSTTKLTKYINLKENIILKMNGYHEIIKFWKDISHISTFKQYIYYEIYRQTHNHNGKRMYNRYFTTLESLVHYNNNIYYPYQISYDDTAYTFIEDFLDSISNDNLCKILS